MKTREQVLEAVKAGRQSQTLDGRDFSRLSDFFPISYWETFGFGPKAGADVSAMYEPKEWTEDNIRAQLADDVAFGFEKAYDQRGLSASAMYEVVKMWMWVMDDPLEHHNDYAPYGLPLLHAVAIKYGFPDVKEEG